MTGFISLGSNLPNGHETVLQALEWLKGYCKVFKDSGVYSSRPTSGFGDDYFNAVADIITDMEYTELESLAKEYEKKAGRDEAARAAGRVPIDIDVVTCDGEVVRRRDYQSQYFIQGLELLNSK